MTLLFVTGLVLVLAAIAVVGMAVRPSQPQGMHRSLAVLEAMSSAPKELTGELDKSFSERVLGPLQARALGLGKRLTGADAPDRIQRKLDLAGNPAGLNPDRVLAFKVLAAGVGLALGFLVCQLLGLEATVLVLGIGVGAVVGFFAPNLYLYQVAYDRAQRMARELPDAIDLMTISVESGLGFDAAVQQVATNTEGPLADELARVLREMQIGQSRSESLRKLAERSSVPELKTFVSSMVQADAFGIPIAQVLRVQSSEIRVKRRQRAEEKAQQVPVKMTIPLIFTILPCLFMAVMGPAVLSIMDSFSG